MSASRGVENIKSEIEFLSISPSDYPVDILISWMQTEE